MDNTHIIARQPTGNPQRLPLLFIHGAWHGAWCWDAHFLPYFAEHGYASYALDLRGHGGHWIDAPMWSLTVDDYVQDVSMAAAHIAQAHDGLHPVLIGHSMGGYVVQKYIERFSVPGAVLFASIPVMGTLPLTLRLLRDYPLTTLTSGLGVRGYPFVKQVNRVHTLFFSAGMPREEVAAYQAKMGNESFRILLDAGLLKRPRPHAAKLTSLFVMAAESDAVFPVSEEEATARAYNVPLHVVDDIAHDMMLEHQWQRSADPILTWLAGLKTTP
jgi:pimeloyl-ACP methyl ester carboxylesterase